MVEIHKAYKLFYKGAEIKNKHSNSLIKSILEAGLKGGDTLNSHPFNFLGDDGEENASSPSHYQIYPLTIDKIEYIDYKEVGRLKKYITEKGKIIPRRLSGNCAKHQRILTVAIKMARNIALLPLTTSILL